MCLATEYQVGCVCINAAGAILHKTFQWLEYYTIYDETLQVMLLTCWSKGWRSIGFYSPVSGCGDSMQTAWPNKEASLAQRAC